MKTRFFYTGTFAVASASNGDLAEKSYCGDEAHVGEIKLGTCLGSAFSVGWMEHADAVDPYTTTIGEQEDAAKKRISSTNVHHYGYVFIRDDKVIDFEGERTKFSKKMKFLEYVKEYNKNSNKKINSSDDYINYLKNKALRTNNKKDILAYKEELRLTARSKRIFQLFREKFNISEEKTDKEAEYNCYISLFNQYKESCGFFIERDAQFMNVFYTYCTGKNASYLATRAIKEICKDF